MHLPGVSVQEINDLDRYQDYTYLDHRQDQPAVSEDGDGETYGDRQDEEDIEEPLPEGGHPPYPSDDRADALLFPLELFDLFGKGGFLLQVVFRLLRAVHALYYSKESLRCKV